MLAAPSLPVALEVRGVSKSFPATRALDAVSLAFAAAEVHGVVGENGAGKSTLMRILAGLERADEGVVLIDGEQVACRSVRDAIERGIAMIHQELNLVGELSVAENIFLGREPTRLGLTDRRRMVREAAALLAAVGSRIDPTTPVSRLAVAERQLVEIAKALAVNARVLIMDEPTAVLSERETSALFALISQLSSSGVTIIYISHLLPEVLAICQRISVLRDGKLVATVRPSEVSESALASLMVGRAMADVFPPRRQPQSAKPRLEVRGIASGAGGGGLGGGGGGERGRAAARSVSFSIAPGEILGLAGLVGSGRTEAAECIVGLAPRDAGEVLLDGVPVRFRGPRDALAGGVAYVSEDRKGRGVHLAMSAVENTTLAHLRDYGKFFPARRRERASTARWIDRLAIRCPDPSAAVGTLSGGNQQKFAVAKWLDAAPRVLLLDEPTRGIDLGAKSEMYRLIADLAANGLACLVISSELPELLGLCHRIAVLREGRVVETLDASEADEHRLMHLAAGVEWTDGRRNAP